ncbi:MFS transporter, partial [Nitratireductor sp. GCM10026969]|uniref:MFS transporter n=1 Tax=Nitratireductor sp. GCM10026969 TaxID=3252645 RepID=UPI003614CA21
VVGGTTFAVALGAPAGSLLAHLLGWRGTFGALALVAAFCLAALWLRLPRDLAAAPSTLAERLLVVRRPGVLPAVLVTFLYLSGAFVIVSYLGPIATEGAGLPHGILPVMLLAFGAGAIAGNYASGRLADRLGARRVVVFSMFCAIAFSATFALVTKFVPDAVAGPLVVGLMVPWGVVGWTFPPAQASRLVAAAPDVAHLTLALNASAIYFGIGFGTFIGGRVLEFGDATDLGLVAAFFPLIALVVLAASRQRDGRTTAVRA